MATCVHAAPRRIARFNDLSPERQEEVSNRFGDDACEFSYFRFHGNLYCLEDSLVSELYPEFDGLYHLSDFETVMFRYQHDKKYVQPCMLTL